MVDIRLSLFLLAALSVIASGARATQIPFEQTCRYFESAAFNDRQTQQEASFRVVLAEDCADALGVLRSAGADTADRDRAMAYLLRLEAYRAELLAIALRGYRAGRKDRASRGYDFAGRTVIRSVSVAGAYLIARSMGLLGEQDAWHAWRHASAPKE